MYVPEEPRVFLRPKKRKKINAELYVRPPTPKKTWIDPDLEAKIGISINILYNFSCEYGQQFLGKLGN